MSIDNCCEFLKKVHADPTAKLPGFTLGDLTKLRAHLTTCEACAILVEEVCERGKDIPNKPNHDGRFN